MHKLRHVSSKIRLVDDLSSQNEKENLAPFKHVDIFINQSNYDLVVSNRGDVPVFVSKPSLQRDSSTKSFIMLRRYRFKNNVSTRRTLDLIKEFKKHHTLDDNEELNIIEQVLQSYSINNTVSNYIEILIKYIVDLSDITECHRIYDRKTDLLISLYDSSCAHPHPFGKIGKGLDEYSDYITNKKGAGVFIEIVDNENIINSRYMFVANKIVEFPVIRNDNKESGIYCTYLSHDQYGNINIDPIILNFEDGEKIGLYKNKEAAYAGGNTEETFKIAKLQLEKELLDSKTNLQQTNEELERQKQETQRLKLELDKNKHTLDNKKLEKEERSLRINEEYENRSLERKEQHEIIKFIPAFLGGMITLFLFMKSTK